MVRFPDLRDVSGSAIRFENLLELVLHLRSYVVLRFHLDILSHFLLTVAFPKRILSRRSTVNVLEDLAAVVRSVENRFSDTDLFVFGATK